MFFTHQITILSEKIYPRIAKCSQLILEYYQHKKMQQEWLRSYFFNSLPSCYFSTLEFKNPTFTLCSIFMQVPSLHLILEEKQNSRSLSSLSVCNQTAMTMCQFCIAEHDAAVLFVYLPPHHTRPALPGSSYQPVYLPHPPRRLLTFPSAASYDSTSPCFNTPLAAPITLSLQAIFPTLLRLLLPLILSQA